MCTLGLRNHLCRTALVYVSNKRGFPGRHHNSIHRLLISFVQTVSTSRVSIVFSRYIQELVPHLLTEQSLGPNVSVIKTKKKKRKQKTRTEFSRFNSLFCPFFFQGNRKRLAAKPGRGSRGGGGGWSVHPTYIHTYIHTHIHTYI